jgi:diacylglycerol kinase (ATP)
MFRRHILGFGYAMKGIKGFFKTERNAWVHLLAAFLAIAMGYRFSLSNMEWCFIVVAIGLVFAAELFNTAIEKLTDVLLPDISEKAALIKDLSAGAVLIVSFAAAVIGIVIFGPKILAAVGH